MAWCQARCTAAASAANDYWGSAVRNSPDDPLRLHEPVFVTYILIVFSLRKPLALLSPIPLIIIGVTLLWIGSTHEYPFWTAPAVAALLAGFVNIRLPWRRAPFRWLVRAGDASYSIYLLHYLVFFLAANVSVRLLSLPEWACEPWRFATILATCIFLCHLGLSLKKRS